MGLSCKVQRVAEGCKRVYVNTCQHGGQSSYQETKMKNIILIFTLFFSLSAFGADKPKTEFDKQGNLVTDIGSVKTSITGLEGWGKKGVRIIVEDYTDIDKNSPLKAIKTKVELRLLQGRYKGC